MKNPENNKWLDDMLTEAISSEKKQPDFEKFQQVHKKEIEMFTSRAGQRQSAKRPLYIRDILMKHKLAKLAAAAVIIIAVITGINHFGGSIDMSTVAWGSLAERVEQIHSYIFQMHADITGGLQGQQQIEYELYASSEYGYRADTYMNDKVMMHQYTLPAEKVIISVMPEQKRYMRMQLTDEHLNKMRQKIDPREMVRQIMLLEYTELGKDTIDGIKVEGIETTDPKYGGGMFEKMRACIWVDVETQLPVRMEMEMQMTLDDDKVMDVSMVMDGFEWDVELEPSIFETNIPSDYALLAEMQMPGQDEGSAIKGLRIYAEITDGKYPHKLVVMKVMKEVMETVKNNSEKEWQSKISIDPNFRPTKEEKEEIRSKTMPKAMAVQGACMFYAELVKQDKDPAYYGDKVTAEDVDKVLMRWKISDDEYRVIFGDLTAEKVSAEQLAELENQLTQ